MKKTFNILAIILLISFCGCKKLLNQPPLSQLQSNQFWKTPDDANAGIAGIYDGLQDMFNTNFIYWGDGRSDNFTYHPTYNDGLPLTLNAILPSTNGADWTPVYETISRANFAIKYIPTITTLDPATSNNYLAQAYAIRAYCYFWLIRLWGNVPLWTVPYEDLSMDPSLPATPAADIMSKEILPDLLNAYQLSDKTAAVVYSVNSGGIAAMLMDVYMYNHDYANALTWCNTLFGLNRYSLETTANWKNNFIAPSTTKECIFSLYWDYIYDGGNKTSTQIGAGDTNSDFAVDPALFAYYAATPTDIRSAQSVDLKVSAHDKVNKYYAANLDKTGNQIYPASTQANIQFSLYRLADIYLLRAEALVQTNDLPNALIYLNFVHVRAGLTAYTALTLSTPALMLAAILKERQYELFCEGKRWFDLQRNGLIVSTMSPFISQRLVAKGFPAAGFGDPNKIFWPINQNVLNANQRLSQNPGY
jgi:hypothetical protein